MLWINSICIYLIPWIPIYTLYNEQLKLVFRINPNQLRLKHQRRTTWNRTNSSLSVAIFGRDC